MFINKSAAARIIGHKVTKLWTMPNGAIGVVYQINNRKCSTLISRKRFFQDGIEYRRNQAVGAIVRPWNVTGGTIGNRYDVLSLDAPKSYMVILSGDVKLCQCEDFQQQQQHGNGFCKPVCKHLFAALDYLDCRSFSDLIAS